MNTKSNVSAWQFRAVRFWLDTKSANTVRPVGVKTLETLVVLSLANILIRGMEVVFWLSERELKWQMAWSLWKIKFPVYIYSPSSLLFQTLWCHTFMGTTLMPWELMYVRRTWARLSMTSMSFSMPCRPPWLSQYSWSRNSDWRSFSLSFWLINTATACSGSLGGEEVGNLIYLDSWQHYLVRW